MPLTAVRLTDSGSDSGGSDDSGNSDGCPEGCQCHLSRKPDRYLAPTSFALADDRPQPCAVPGCASRIAHGWAVLGINTFVPNKTWSHSCGVCADHHAKWLRLDHETLTTLIVWEDQLRAATSDAAEFFAELEEMREQTERTATTPPAYVPSPPPSA